MMYFDYDVFIKFITKLVSVRDKKVFLINTPYWKLAHLSGEYPVKTTFHEIRRS